VVVPIGVGALAAAAVRHYRRAALRSQPALLGVEPLGADCVLRSAKTGQLRTLEQFQPSIMAGLNCETPSLVAWPLVSAGMDAFVAIGDDAVRRAMRDLASCGVVAGETGAAALAGLQEILSGSDAPAWRERLHASSTATVLVMCTEGATDPDAYQQIVGRPPEDIVTSASSSTSAAGTRFADSDRTTSGPRAPHLDMSQRGTP
jgi:diaminopropionate ammonia-lyase